MGWDIERFPELNHELICCICAGVLDDPVEIRCRHIFCHECLKTWLSKNKAGTCPSCRAPVHRTDFRAVAPMLKNIIGKQVIFCDNREMGCGEKPYLENLKDHLSCCQHGIVACQNDGCTVSLLRKDAQKHIDECCPQRKVLCTKGCGIEMPYVKLESHNCIAALRSHFTNVTSELQQKIAQLEEKVIALTSANHQLSQSNEQTSRRRRVPIDILCEEHWTTSYPSISYQAVNIDRNNRQDPVRHWYRSRSPTTPEREFTSVHTTSAPRHQRRRENDLNVDQFSSQRRDVAAEPSFTPSSVSVIEFVEDDSSVDFTYLSAENQEEDLA